MRCEVRSLLRRRASTRALWSSAVTTSRTPLRSAWTECGDVDPVPQEDDAELRSVQPGRLGELAGLLQADLRADDDLLDAQVVVQRSRHQRRGVERLGVSTEREAISLQRRRVGVPEDVHLTASPSIVWSFTDSFGFTLTSEPRRPA